MRKAFGRTWWGNAWVKAMERIDYNTNRLPRGRKYANNGSVKSIEIKDGHVFAAVQGSRPKPYSIKIKLNGFNDREIQQIRDTIGSNPAIASELGIGKLPESLLTILESEKIHVLPQNWKDIHADCSCPDWANPCKHLAAVYYIIANEIDKDPFLIFNLRGISTKTLVESAGLAVQDGDVPEQSANIFIPYDKIETSKFQPPDKEHPLELPDLSFRPVDLDVIFSLLQDNPLFYRSGNFKSILFEAYKNTLNAVEKLEIDEDINHKFFGADFYLIANDEGYVFFVSPPDYVTDQLLSGCTKKRINAPTISRDSVILKKITGIECVHKASMMTRHDKEVRNTIFDIFLSSPIDTGIDHNSPSARFLNIAASVALAFIRSVSFIPQVIKDHSNGFSIRYVPVVYDKKAKSAVDYLKSIMPLNFCFTGDGRLMTAEGVYEILSLIITYIFHKYCGTYGYDKICGPFFYGLNYKAEGFQEMQTAKAVVNWLEGLSIRKKDISPVIRVETYRDNIFKVNIDVENKKDPLSPVIPLSELFKAENIFSCPAGSIRADVSRQIIIASEYMPKLRDVLNSRGVDSALITSDEMADFMTRASNIFDILGIKTAIPKELKKIAVPRLAIKAAVKGKSQSVSYLSIDSILDFSWEIAIGDKTIPKDEFLKLVKSSRGIVRFKDQYILLSPDEVKNILDKINKPVPRMTSAEMLHSAFAREAEGLLFNIDDIIKSLLDDITRIEDVTLPVQLNAVLRPYQERGFKWLYSNTTKGFGSCIADDMGLGKTIQVIALLLKLKEERKIEETSLVVCPTTLVGNWYKECQKFAPTLNVTIYHGAERGMSIKNRDLLITTYGVMRRDIDKFKDKKWGLVIIDEAQSIKNPNTDQTKAVKALNAKSYIAMTGTPVENRLTELWSIFDFINKGYLGHLNKFKQIYGIPIEKYRDQKQIERLRAVTAPFLLRRLKSDKSIIRDLPDKVIFDEYCYLSKEQTALYQQVVDTTMKIIEKSEGIEKKGLIFKLITSLKQICNHPFHYTKKGRPSVSLSGKAEKTIGLIESILAMKEKALIFTQYKEMGEILVEMIKESLKEDAMFFHGGLTRAKRDMMVESFQTVKAVKLMVVSLKAGGTGLNLTAAQNVIHYDLWWNPAVETQATDRTYRIGQDKNVMVHRLITLGTFEEKIDEMIKSKKELADMTVATGEKWITELSNMELREIFSLS